MPCGCIPCNDAVSSSLCLALPSLSTTKACMSRRCIAFPAGTPFVSIHFSLNRPTHRLSTQCARASLRKCSRAPSFPHPLPRPRRRARRLLALPRKSCSAPPQPRVSKKSNCHRRLRHRIYRRQRRCYRPTARESAASESCKDRTGVEGETIYPEQRQRPRFQQSVNISI